MAIRERDKNRDWSNINRKHCINLRSKLYSLLGDKCIICGENDKDVLQLDHINNDGKRDRLKFTGLQSYREYLKEPEISKHRLQILCANCNIKKQRILEEFNRLEKNEIIGF